MALMPVAEALAAILAGADPMPEEMVALDAAYHRTLARDVAARTHAAEAMSAMDRLMRCARRMPPISRHGSR